MARIHPLSQSIINKIAAGEVIERPASVVKEFMENAIDAGATRIDVSVEAGGADLVRVVDNGCGIAAEDLPLAVASHATSKIASAEDLFRVGTLGFRGEALASIAEVSRLTLRSRPPESESGAELEVVGGQATAVSPCGCPAGTAIEVRNLFFNTPVRKKFLRSTQTELGHVSEGFLRVALAFPQVHFTLRHNDRPVFELPGTPQWLSRIAAIFGRQLAENLIWVESQDGPVRLSGYVAHPSQSRSNNHMQYLFLNGRSIRDRSLQHALGEAYRGLLMVGRFPIALLFLEMPPESVDVNVHPTKLEVRFQDSGRLYSQLLATLRTKFLSTDLTTRVQTPAAPDSTSAHDDQKAVQLRQQLVDWAKGKVSSWETTPAGGENVAGEAASGNPLGLRERALDVVPLDRHWAPVGGAGDEEPPGGASPGSASDRFSPGISGQPASSAGAMPHFDRAAFGGEPQRPVKALQIHNRYLVAESDEGVLVIDQHALHERILYEHLRARILAGSVESQNLLVPEPVDLNPSEAAAALEERELLAQLGMKIEAFGGDTVLITSYPAMLANMNPVEVLHEIVGRLVSGGKPPDRRDLLDSLLHTIACKAAVKAGDYLAPEEVQTLVQQRHLIDDAHHCPHGRPTALVFSREELDKQFRRV